MDRDDITFEEMKTYLSYLRAYDVGRIVEILIKQKRQVHGGQKNLKIDIVKKGEGTNLPDNKLQYEPVDERRRTVKVRWTILSN